MRRLGERKIIDLLYLLSQPSSCRKKILDRLLTSELGSYLEDELSSTNRKRSTMLSFIILTPIYWRFALGLCYALLSFQDTKVNQGVFFM